MDAVAQNAESHPEMAICQLTQLGTPSPINESLTGRCTVRYVQQVSLATWWPDVETTPMAPLVKIPAALAAGRVLTAFGASPTPRSSSRRPTVSMWSSGTAKTVQSSFAATFRLLVNGYQSARSRASTAAR